MIRMSVDFPAPFSPSRAWTSPPRTSKLTSFSAGNPAKDLAMPCSSTMLVTRCPPCQIGPPALRGKAVTTDGALQCTRGSRTPNAHPPRRGPEPPRPSLVRKSSPLDVDAATRCDALALESAIPEMQRRHTTLEGVMGEFA